jgi:class 3 adenylate cyclase
VRLFHNLLDERLGAEGHPTHSWSDDLNQVAASMMASLERTVVLLYRRHFEHYILDVTVLRAEAGLERAGLARRRPLRPPAIAFLDLTGYTKLTEERGDRAAAELAGRLIEIVHDRAQARGGRPVKFLGDGVMFHFPEPAQGVLCALELVDRIPELGLPRARVGLHSGPVVFQNGDYFGRTVNAAARIGDYARPGEVLVSEDVVAVDTSDAVRYEPVSLSPSKGSARRSRSPSRFAPSDAERVFEKSIVVRCGSGIAGPPRLRWATGFLPLLAFRPTSQPGAGRWGWGGVCGGRPSGVAGRACGRGRGS